MEGNMSQREYVVTDAFVDSLFDKLYSAYLEREKLLEDEAQIYLSEPNEKNKERLEKRLSLAQSDVENMLDILETHKYDENIEYIKDNLRRKIDHIIEIRNGIRGMGLI